MKPKIRERIFWAVLISIAHILITKPAIDIGNLAIQIPMIRFFDGSASFGTDPIVHSFKHFASYFYILLSYLHISDSALKIFFGVSYFVLDSIIFYLILSIWNLLNIDKNTAILSAVIIAGGYLPVLSSANWSYVFSHQMIGIIFALLSIFYLLSGKNLLAFVFIGIGINFHAIFLAPVFVFALIYLISERKYSDSIFGSIICFLLSLPILFFIYKNNVIIEDVRLWRQIASVRSPEEVFPFRQFLSWIPIISFSAIFAQSSMKRWNSIKSWARPLLITTIVFALLQLVFSEIWLIPNLAKIQFLRCSLYYVLLPLPIAIEYIIKIVKNKHSKIFFLMPIFGSQPPGLHILLADFLFRKIPIWLEYILGISIIALYFLIPFVSQNSTIWGNFSYFDIKLYLRNGFLMLFSLAILFFAVKTGKVQRLHRVLIIFVLIIGIVRSFIGGVFVTQDKEWVDVQKWARYNTDRDDIFLVPPNMGSFRVYSHRGIVFDWKGGTFALYFSWRYAKEWWKRLQDFHPTSYTPEALANAYRKMSKNDKLVLAKKYHSKYIVVSNPNDFKEEPVYSNTKWSIYKSR